MKAIEILDLHYKYLDGPEVLDGISFCADEGERIGLIGPNGAGKSTLLLHLNGLLPENPSRDSKVKIFDLPVAEPNLALIRSRVGLLFQDPDDQLFCSSVWDDVAFGPQQMKISQSEIKERVEQALQKVDMSKLAGRNPANLSRGEKQRACLAGLLSCDCRILALDEPSANLDPRGRRELKELLRSLPQTQIIASHDLELIVELCPRVIVLDEGKIVADGSTTEILSDELLMLKHGLERPHILSHRHPHDQAKPPIRLIK